MTWATYAEPCWFPCPEIWGHDYSQIYLAVTTFLVVLNTKPLRGRWPCPPTPITKGWCFVLQWENMYTFLLNPSPALKPHVWMENIICQFSGSWRLWQATTPPLLNTKEWWWFTVTVWQTFWGSDMYFYKVSLFWQFPVLESLNLESSCIVVYVHC